MTSEPTDRVAAVSRRADGTPDQQPGWQLIEQASEPTQRPTPPDIEMTTLPAAERAVAPRQRRKEG